MVYFNGDLYEGKWENDKKNGIGRLEYASLGVYCGELVEDKKAGKGRFYDKVRDEIYEGEWNQDKKNGEGTLVRRKTCDVIVGDFRNDMFEGKQKFEKTLTKNEVEIYFARAIKDNQRFIVAGINYRAN